MKYMSEYEILKLLENLDRQYLNLAKTSDNVTEKKFSQKAHFVVGRIRREFKEKLKKDV